MTETEAKTKWCPFARRASAFTSHILIGEGPTQTIRDFEARGFSANRTDKDEPLGNCIGSACMAWRWTGEGKPEPNGGPVGFCGLAGKP